MVDVSKIRAGDRVTIHATVSTVDDGDSEYPFAVRFGAAHSDWNWITADAIATHIPAPREFKTGDIVTLRESSKGRAKWKILSFHDGYAFLFSEQLCGAHIAERITNLRHADLDGGK